MSSDTYFKRTAILVSVMILAMTVVPQGQVTSFQKHVIVGIVSDSTGTTIFEAEITATNLNTMEILTTETGTKGAYSLDLSNFASGFFNGDKIDINATYGSYYKNGTIIVDTTGPTQMLNLVLDMNSHIIYGQVTDHLGAPFIYRVVIVSNVDKSESQFILTNLTGGYRIDLGLNQNASDVGDTITTSVEYNGFTGANSTLFNLDNSQAIDVRLFDTRAPSISVDAPASVNIGENIIIKANVTDNYQIDYVDLYHKEMGDLFFTVNAMVQDDGSTNDWNSNSLPDPELYGFTIAAQNDIGDVSYYIESSDGNNTITSPELVPETLPYTISVVDVTPPLVTHTQPAVLEAGFPMEIVALITDDVEVGAAILHFKGVGEPAYTNYTMSPTGEPNEFNASIPAQFSLGSIEYDIRANDTSENLMVTSTYNITVDDTMVPDIIHSPVNSAHVWDLINITANVTDIIGIGSVFIDYTGVNTTNYNVSMSKWGDNWSYDIPGQVTPGIVSYTIWAKDTSENTASHPAAPLNRHSILITDNNTPIITHTPVERSEVFENITINVNVTDDVGVTEVTLAYKNETDSGYTFLTMNLTSGSNISGNWTTLSPIPPPANLETISYYVNATDGTNNISHPAILEYNNITVEDTARPDLKPVPLSYQVQTFGGPIFEPINLSVNVTDNYNVSVVTLFYRPVDNLTWQSLDMISTNNDTRGNGTYNASIPGQLAPGNLTYYFWANDTSDNLATSPELNPKIEPYHILIFDAEKPKLYHTRPQTGIGVNRSIDLFVEVTDNIDVANVGIGFQGSEDLFEKDIFGLPYVGDNTYVFTVPLQNLSGQIVYRFRAFDDEDNYNYTDSFTMDVINDLPEISHQPTANQSFEVPLSILATVSDDLAVLNATLHWKYSGAFVFSRADMTRTSENPPVYLADLGLLDVGTIEYYFTANDSEGTARNPDNNSVPNVFSVSLLDFESPVISHTPLEPFNTSRIPVFSATVTDNRAVVNVTLFYKNSTMDDFTSIKLAPVYNQPGNYSNILYRQSAGNFSYYITADDGYNSARSPVVGSYEVEVTPHDYNDGSDGNPFLFILIALMIIALLLIFVAYTTRNRSKEDKEETEEPKEDIIEDGEQEQ